MTQDLAGQVAIVTGGSDGIGLATAALLVRRGATVVICGRRQEQLDIASAHIEGEGGKVEAVQLDVTDFPAFEALIADVAARHGRLDMLVNNAMSVHYAPISKLTLDHWRKDFAVNTEAVFVGTKAAMAVMAAASFRIEASIFMIRLGCCIRVKRDSAITN
jgi:NAD(P)-dependent dehydrogenase (short-subunit alcohol dehydrogenase family)